MNANFSISQNFLSNPELVKKLIKLAEIPLQDTVLDIGVGKGIISKQLLDLGYKVLGFEIDSNLTKNLSPEIINNKTSFVNSTFHFLLNLSS
jgi:16S rRNA A1518/A1519 N6-dimethyltransferase RsmA/KsgA/DIM1 with predicted DNA glycosylase/AP lyase activity